MYFYGFDISYFIYVLPPMLLALWAQYKVKSTFAQYSRVASDRGMTGYDAARLILDANGLRDISVTKVAGELTDHYDPSAGQICLSDAVYGVPSAAAVGVAAHEAGHAVQHAVGYVPMQIRSSLVPIANFGSRLSVPLILLGILMAFETLAYAGVILFFATVLFQLVTLPVEFNASRRALEALEGAGTVSAEGLQAAKNVLTAAALTYVTSLLVSVGNLLRLLTIVRRNDRR